MAFVGQLAETDILEKIKNTLTVDKKHYLLFFYILLVTMFFGLRWPIKAVDTDLWYHLDGGRYFVDNLEVFKSSYFSFLTPERQFVNYYWLFQVLAYLIYDVSGYYGLIVLRALGFSSMLYFIFRLLKKNQAETFFPFVLLLCPVLLIERSFSIRPHIFSYLFISIFLYVLEFHPKKMKYLPAVAVLWMNFHGIEYPVMILMVMAYVIEYFICRIRNKTDFENSVSGRLHIPLLALAALFATPHTVNLLTIPFRSTGYASTYINELRPFRPEQLVNFELDKLTPTFPTLMNVYIILVLAIVILRLLKKDMRISHLILFSGGLFLLVKSHRFLTEFVLLTLPAIRTDFIFQKRVDRTKIQKIVCTLGVFAVISATTAYCIRCFSSPPKYPVSNSNLPKGVAAFLKTCGKSGSVLNFPDSGGYLRWALQPDYRIAMDMEVPFLFSDEDFYFIRNAYANRACFEKFVKKYDPPFITVPMYFINRFESWKSQYPYRLVFFDDAEALYVNSKIYPETADRYGLKYVAPVNLANIRPEIMEDNIKAEYMNELLAISEIYPESKLINTAIVSLLVDKGEFEKAHRFNDLVLSHYSELSVGYILKGDILAARGQFDEAVRFYNKAMKKINDDDKKLIVVKKLWNCHTRLGSHQKAYKILKKNLDVYGDDTGYKDLYELGYSAFQIGKIEEGKTLMKYAYLKIPSDDMESRKKIENILNSLKKFD